LTKQSAKNGALTSYQCFLFNDLLCYVSGAAHSYTVHRVLHLSLCQIKDLRDGFVRGVKNAFRIISPQKNIILIAETSKEKHEWFQLIESAIEKQMEHRARWINENYQTLQEYHESARVSKFLGRNAKPKKHELLRVQNGKAMKNEKEMNPEILDEIKIHFHRSYPCKLCQKPFKRLSRKVKCPWCLDIVCYQCFSKKTSIPDKKSELQNANLIKVCDACYGAISYFAHDITNPHSLMNEPTNDFSELNTSVRR